MRWPRALFLTLLLLPPLSGCRSNCHLVESELHAREEDVRILREELRRTRLYNHALRQELHAYQGAPCPEGGCAPATGYAIREVVLGRGTGGHQGGPCGADDGLEVQLEPRDPEGQAVKVPGAVAVEVLEIDDQGLKRPLSSWEVPPEVLQRSWRSGLFTTGYRLTFPWKVWPTTEKLRVVARLRLTDGRVFEADKDVEVRLLPEAERRHALPEKAGPIPPAPKAEPLHPPTPAPGSGGEGPSVPPSVPLPFVPPLEPTDTISGVPLARGQSPEPQVWRAATPYRK